MYNRYFKCQSISKYKYKTKKKLHHEYGRNVTGMGGDAGQGGSTAKRKDGRKGSRKVRSLVKK